MQSLNYAIKIHPIVFYTRPDDDNESSNSFILSNQLNKQHTCSWQINDISLILKEKQVHPHLIHDSIRQYYILTTLRRFTTPSTISLAGTFGISLVQPIAIITGVFSCWVNWTCCWSDNHFTIFYAITEVRTLDNCIDNIIIIYCSQTMYIIDRWGLLCIVWVIHHE